jgi:8-oxo-dGTP pyrophosphatase MutT (NUDIX family)
LSKVIAESPGKWVSLVTDDEGRFFWSRRKGQDSISVVIVRKDSKDRLEVLIHQEFNPAHVHYRDLNYGAIGGSIDKDKDLVDIAVEEVREEGGFDVTREQMVYCGKFACTTQSDEHVHCYVVDVTGMEELELELEPGEIRYQHDNAWKLYSDDLLDLEDPRFVVTMARYLR